MPVTYNFTSLAFPAAHCKTLLSVRVMTFRYFNCDKPDPTSSLPSTFSLTCPSGTDIWRKPPDVDRFNAPILYQTLSLNAFRRASVTLRATWSTLYDQGGLCLVRPQSHRDEPRKWIKTGIEFTHGSPHISTVSCDRWADWSLLSLEGSEVTIEMEREVKAGQRTSTLWIYAIAKGERRPIREVTWAFESLEHAKSAEPECWVGIYAARPSKDTHDAELEVKFKDLEINTWDD